MFAYFLGYADGAELEKEVKQVDILISKNQSLQILYLKHCVRI